MPLDLKGMIFDLDGTLAETWPICFDAFRNVFKHYTGRVYSDEEIEAMYGPDEEGIIKRLVPDLWQEGVEMYLREYELAHNLCEEPFPGIKEALELLKERGVLLAVVTGKGIGSADISLKRLGLSEYFDIVEPGHPSGGRKPDSIRKVLKKWQIAPEKTAYIGDSPSDSDGAKEVGMIALGAAWSVYADKEKIAARNPSAIFINVASFIDWIKQNVSQMTN